MEILRFACHTYFTSNHILVNTNGPKMTFWHFLRFWILIQVILSNFQDPILLKLKVESLRNCKMAIFDIQILPKLISHKIEWQINCCIVDINFTFCKFLEHSGIGTTYLRLLKRKSWWHWHKRIATLNLWNFATWHYAPEPSRCEVTSSLCWY